MGSLSVRGSKRASELSGRSANNPPINSIPKSEYPGLLPYSCSRGGCARGLLECAPASDRTVSGSTASKRSDSTSPLHPHPHPHPPPPPHPLLNTSANIALIIERYVSRQRYRERGGTRQTPNESSRETARVEGQRANDTNSASARVGSPSVIKLYGYSLFPSFRVPPRSLFTTVHTCHGNIVVAAPGRYNAHVDTLYYYNEDGETARENGWRIKGGRFPAILHIRIVFGRG